jgi:hypothetical protein
MRRCAVRVASTCLLFGLLVGVAFAHIGDHPSVHDTVAGIVDRFRREVPHDVLRTLTVPDALQRLTPEERHVLSTEHISFTVNAPVVVWVVRDANLGDEPFWLPEEGFERTPLRVTGTAGYAFDVWRKAFAPGRVGLGVNSLGGGREHYFIAVSPQETGGTFEITDLYPGQLAFDTLRAGVRPYVDRPEVLETVPAELDGRTLVRTLRGRRDDARLMGVFLFTEHPSSDRPDHIVLTWSDDPRTSQTIQWRTSPKVKQGAVLYQRKADRNLFQPREPLRAQAQTSVLETPDVVNDAIVHRHTATLRGLQPNTTYVYSVGDATEAGWTELREFTTAPDGVQPFSFIYMGDAQNGLDRWGSLLRTAFRERPDAAFYLMAGDIVNRGAQRDDWDSLFHNAEGIYDRRTLVPVIGNHECQGGHPTLYLHQFTLMTNGPAEVEPERAYAFEYSNALFVVLDSNLSPESQAPWLEEVLSKSNATWKFVSYHHPAYSSSPGRDNKRLRDVWTPIFDKYHVDMALQGHDHAYLRTYPMKAQQRVESPAEGTVYIISVSGVKMYPQAPHDYIEFGMTNISTYQVLDIQIAGNRLVYRAYDQDGDLRDEIVIEK